MIGLLAVLVVVGIASAITHHNLGRASGSYAVRAEARRIHAELANARARAMSEGREHALSVRSGRSLLPLVRQGGRWAEWTPALVLPDHVSLDVNGASDAHIVFGPTGRPDRPYALVLTSSGPNVTLHLFASGMISWSQ